MPQDLVQWGNVPEWLEGLAATGAALGGIGARRQRSAKQWAAHFEALVGMAPDELRRRLENNDVAAETVAAGFSAGARATDDSKRKLLARAAAVGIMGDENVTIDDVPLFVRTLDDIEAVHMKLLRLVMEPVAPVGVGLLSASGGTPTESLASQWPAIAETIDPLLAALVREGLVRDVSVPGSIGTIGPEWKVSPYGERFIRFVLTGAPELRTL